MGPMLQGLAKPVNDLSRGALVEDLIYTMALTAIQARASQQAGRGRPRRAPPSSGPGPLVRPPGSPVRPAPTPAYLLLVVRYRVLVSGRVQGVFFRDTCRRLALEHSVAGWVRNLPDGRVEAVFEGLADDVARLIEWARHGPRLAVVEAVAVQPEQPEGLAAFDIR